MEAKAISVWSIQIENSKRAINKIRFIIRKQSWNQSMAAYDSDIKDFEIDEETILESEFNLKFIEYYSKEIEVNPTKEFNLDELDYIDKDLINSPLLHNVELPDIKLIEENNIPKVVSSSNDKYCENCGKNTRRKSLWTNINFYVNKYFSYHQMQRNRNLKRQ